VSEADGLPTATAILQAVRESARGPLKPKELARELDVPTERYGDFKEQLAELETEGKVYRVKGGRYAVPEKINLVVGRLSLIRSGDGFVVPEDGKKQPDVYVPFGDLASAMDGDQVVARIEARPRGRNPVGRIIKVLERAHPKIVGTYRRTRNFGYVVPKEAVLPRDVLIPQGEERGARDRDVVVVRMVSFGDRKLNPVGEVEEVLGPITDPGVDILAIVHGYGLAPEFPQEVSLAAEDAARHPERRPEADPGRVDRRDLLVFTIDPADAKDHDDALSIVSLGGDRWEVGIHIADVSAFVERGGPVDLEALERGTSVYLVDRVIPMLPHALSSDVCSLRADEDRAAVSVFAVLDGTSAGRVESARFERTLIRSRHKLAYEVAQEVLDGERSVDPETDSALRSLAELARTLRARREGRGSLDFDLPEARVILGAGGEPVDIQRVARLESHRLIEDFMLLANEIVATEAVNRRLPILHRVHEPPSAQKVEALREFLRSLGHSLPKHTVRPRDLEKVLERVRGKPEENLVNTVVLRSMQRARYAAESLGHFGLALEHYCHFTSPIRRYPDLVTHRVVVRALIDGKPVPESWGGEELELVAERSSAREQAASEAERDSVELKKVEFMERHLGDRFTGIISGVVAFGFFVLLDDYFVEGLVHVNALRDDYYEFREEEYSLVGDRRGRRFRLGDRVRVQVARVDKEERKVDFLLEEVLPHVSA
jgi:ribonuclease R